MPSSTFDDLISTASEYPYPKKLKYSIRPVWVQYLATEAMAPESGWIMKYNNSYQVNH